jgi:hypothetical protein
MMFSIKDRNHLHDHILQLAASDKRIVAGAVVGSLALGEGDRWSDLDLTFSVADEYSIFDVLEDWTRNITKTFSASRLFDFASGTSIYRVFLLPGCLQFDLSFTPASSFGATGPKFRLIFGQSVEKPYPKLPNAQELFGYAVHHALRARFCIERKRYWQAEYWISATRDYALHLACLRCNLPSYQGRGFDDLPVEILDVFSNTFVTRLTREELLRALSGVIHGLLREVNDVQGLDVKVKPQLLELTTEWSI